MDNIEIIPRPDTVHGNRAKCHDCGAGWWTGLGNKKGRNKTSKYKISDVGEERCQLCRRGKPMLGKLETLELHHLDCDPANDVLDNLLVVCTKCHSEIHHNITYLYDHFTKEP